MSRKIIKTITPSIALFHGDLYQAPRAAIAVGHEAEVLHDIASSFGLISAALDDLAPEGLVGLLTTVSVSEEHEPALPEVEGATIDMLMQLALAQGRIKTIAESAADGDEVAVALSGDDAANAAVATPQAEETPIETGAASAADAAVVAAVVPDDLARQIWPQIATGQVVLVPDYDAGEFNGWWPATVLNRTAKSATLKWVGFDELPAFSKPVTQLAVTHPAYRS